MRRLNEVSHSLSDVDIDILFLSLRRQIYTASGNRVGGDTFMQQRKTVRFTLVTRLTTSGFHVKYQRLIIDYKPLSVPHNSLYSYCCLFLEETAQTCHLEKVHRLLFCIFETGYLHNVFSLSNWGTCLVQAP